MRIKKLLKITIESGLCIISLLVTVYAQTTERVTIDTYYPAPYVVYSELRANRVAVGPNTVMPASDGDLSWTNNPAVGGGTLSTTQGASIELRGDNMRPYIDFSNDLDLTSNYDARVSLFDDNTVSINTRQEVEVRDTDTGNHGDLWMKCIRYHWTAMSGTICIDDLVIIS